MDIVSINADKKLASIAESIGRNPLSWDGWFCLRLVLHNIEEDLYQECQLWVRSILDSYLVGIEGRCYFLDDKSVHILANTKSRNIFEQAGEQICALLKHESALNVDYAIYDLVDEGLLYAHSVLRQTKHSFSLPVSIHAGLDITSLLKPVNIRPERIKVLLIEDDPVTRWMVRNALKEECEFVTAPSASKAYALYESYKPNIIFLDINLPDGNGHAVLEWIIRNDPNACVVMFSGNNNLDNISQAMKNGASGFIAKPFMKDSLLHYVRHFAKMEVV